MEIEKEMSTTPAYKKMSTVFHQYWYQKDSDLESISLKVDGKYKDFIYVVEHEGFSFCCYFVGCGTFIGIILYMVQISYASEDYG